ncbi:hypothetical protein AAC387_Pa10g2097 [Persea americana]
MLKQKIIRFLLLPKSPTQSQRLFSHNPTPPTSLHFQNLTKIVTSIGSLDDLEADLNRSAIPITPSLFTQIIDSCKSTAPNRRLLRFFSWSLKNPNFHLGDEPFNSIIRVFADKKDLTAIKILLSELQKEVRVMETQTFSSVVETLLKLGREDDAIGLFKNLDKFQCPQNQVTLSVIVHALCSKGYARKAEGVVWHHKDRIFIEPCVYMSLLHGWCVHGNAKEARRTLEEMKSLGFYPGLNSYNTFLNCICKRNLKFNPSALVSDATNVMTEMRATGVRPNAASFNILLSCLGKTRRVKEACRVLSSMREMGCSPDWVSYYLVVRVLFLTGRFGRGNRIVDRMIEEGVFPEARFYHGLIGVLCGIEKVGHALEVFERMKKSCVGDHGPVYDLLIAKFCTGGEFDKGRKLWDETVERGVVLRCSSDLLDPSKSEVFKPTRKVEKVSLGDWKRVVEVPKKQLGRSQLKRKKKKRASAT